ncbi:MAG: tRNA modification GTPase [Fimbriiglobus sp.]|jgi:tRNA modification GTPase|nr:tRNA modification GTPase [Fimbriiglobus sp.]
MTPHPDDTIVALSSAPGAGLRAIVRVSGPQTAEVVRRVFVPDGMPRDGGERGRTLTPGHLTLSGVHSPLPADLYFFRGPNTYTGQDLAELHTISSPPLLERLIADLLAAGARSAQPGEFTLRAFLAGKKDLPQAEAVLAVIESKTDADLQESLKQLAGGVTQPLATLRSDLLNLLADVEAALDFVDEDIEFVSKRDTLLRISAALAHLTNLNRQLDGRTVSGRTIRIALVGEPNAGKSSLFNALAGNPAALVSDIPGTTRDYLTAVIELNGIQAELIDTAGWQTATDTIEAQAQQLGREQGDRADLVLWCVPVGETPGQPPSGDVILVRTKADLVAGIADKGYVSVVTGAGLSEFEELLAEKLTTLARSPLAPSQARCRAHVASALTHLRSAHAHCVADDPPELLALALRAALDQIGEMAGAVYTNDLLDRIFSRFCIGK